ncbi:alpha/beta fold hydrolase [Ramlibacter sp.]|uniref:alpha/beta fold hydrolase n=1 Tax=Ramlibacter sp. TaxID=1917967 RepID=UPI003D10EC31
MKATLLLVPGILNDERLWDAVAPQLESLADVRRAPAPSQDSIAAMADAAWRLLDDLPADAPVVLGGFSLGGYVAIEMLSRPARAVRGVALMSTSGRPESPEAHAAREKSIAAMRKDFSRVLDGILQFGTHEATRGLLLELKDMMLRVGAETAIRQNRAAQGRGDHRAMLAKLDLPVTVVCGRQDRITPPALSEELAALVPGARLQWVDGCGHMLPAERPDALADALRPLLIR